MAFGPVHSSVERSTSRHCHPQASARLLYRMALVLILGFIVSKWLTQYIPWTQTRNVVLFLEIIMVAYPLWYTQAEVQKVYTPLKPQEEQICFNYYTSKDCMTPVFRRLIPNDDFD